MTAMLNPGDTFPAMTLTSTDGTSINLPPESETPFTLVLFYRGHW
jgi:peroxiredoxin